MEMDRRKMADRRHTRVDRHRTREGRHHTPVGRRRTREGQAVAEGPSNSFSIIVQTVMQTVR